MRILLVEDDQMLGAALSQALRDAAHALDWVRDGESAVAASISEQYDLVLLDLSIPAPDGLTVLKTLRMRNSALPVIIVTARDSVEMRIAGLDLGADDYVTKPFAVGELLARIRAVLRRQGSGTPATLSNGIVNLNPATREAVAGSASCQLTAREFTLLHALLSRPGVIQSRGELETRIYGWNEEVESNAIEFIIHSIRKKLGPSSIRNVRGAGWMVDRGS